jgi:formate C-acetyltransferase
MNLVHTKYREVKDLSILTDDPIIQEPVVVRKAKALALALDETRPVILDDELIVGLRTLYSPLQTGQNVFGSFDYELPVKPATNHCLNYFPHYLTADECAELKPAGIKEGYAIAHVPFGVHKLLTLGYGGIIDSVQQRIEELSKTHETSSKIDFLRAVIIVFKAASRFAQRHAGEAERLIQEIISPQRKQELKNLAETCRWISVHPPRSFHEALQLFWFTAIIHKVEGQSCLPIGRFDQDLYPYYKKDRDAGLHNQAEALELLECLWIKLNLESDLTTDTCENITLSGQDRTGMDVTNELTYLCLDTSLDLKLADPKINVRFHQKSPKRLWMKCCELVKSGLGGFPTFFNDDANIPGLIKLGIPLQDARLYSCDGCQEIIIPGKGDFYPTFTGISFLGCLLQVLNRPNSYVSFDEFMGEYKHKLSEAIKDAVILGNLKDSTMANLSPTPFLSATLEGCIEQGRDKTSGGTEYNFTGCLGRAFSHGVNSLAVIKKIVFDESLYSMETLREALANNWDGYERLRQLAMNRVPKYGNDDDYVDDLAVAVADHFIHEVLKYKNPRGGSYYPGIFTFHHVTRGKFLGASPDGRRAGEGLTSHISPVVGTDLKGPTAVINSAVKICRLQPPEGAALGVRFHPTAIQGERGIQNLISFIKTFMDQGGICIQFNVVDSETLRRAQQSPEEYRNLIVRVWGFSAYFVTLTRQYQDDVIARTEHGFR